MRGRVLGLSLLLALAACHARPKGPQVTLTLDGAPTSLVIPAGPVPLRSILPKEGSDPTSWLYLEAKAGDGRFLDVKKPAEAGLEARVSVEGGKVTLGLYRPVKQDLPPAVAAIARQPAALLPDVREIEIDTHEPQEVALGPPPLTIRVPGQGPEEVEAARLQALPEWNGQSPRQRGWLLADVVGLRVPKEKITEVEVTGAEKQLRILRSALDDPKQHAVLKLNMRGELVFHQWAEGSPDPKSEVRGVSDLKVETADARAPDK